MQALVGTTLCKFGGDPVMFVVEEAIFVTSEKCPYHVTFDLDLDLEHTLDAGPCGDHRVQVWWRSSHVSGRSSDLRVKVYRQSDRQTDGRRTPRDCISSFQWNELKKPTGARSKVHKISQTDSNKSLRWKGFMESFVHLITIM